MKIKKNNFKLTKDKNNVLTVSPLPTDKSIFNFYEKKYFQENYGTYKNQNYSRDEINFNYFEPKIVNYFLSTKKKNIRYRVWRRPRFTIFFISKTQMLWC